MKYGINEVDVPGIIYYNDKMAINYNLIHKFEEENLNNVPEDKITKNFPVFDYFKVKDKHGKFIHLGNYIPRSILFREDMQEELLRFLLPKYILLDVKFIYRKKCIENYKALFLEEDMIKYTDFAKSVFLADDISLPYGSDRSFEFTVNSLQELYEFRKDERFNSLHIKSLTLTSEFPQYDLFNFNMVNSRWYCSDRMKEWFLKNDDPEWPFMFYKPEFSVHLSNGERIG